MTFRAFQDGMICRDCGVGHALIGWAANGEEADKIVGELNRLEMSEQQMKKSLRENLVPAITALIEDLL